MPPRSPEADAMFEGGLPADTYHRVVSPALQVTAELAAVRGDPELYNDMTSMLVLHHLVGLFAAWEPEQASARDAKVRRALAEAPDATCTMVLQRAELDPRQLGECIWALNAAGKLLAEAHIFAGTDNAVRPAWNALLAGQREQAVARLKFAAGNLAGAIDRWERERNADAAGAA